MRVRFITTFASLTTTLTVHGPTVSLCCCARKSQVPWRQLLLQLPNASRVADPKAASRDLSHERNNLQALRLGQQL